MGGLFGPLQLYLPLSGFGDSYFSCDPLSLITGDPLASGYVCGNLSETLSFTANCTVNSDGTIESCSAEITDSSTFKAYLSQQASYIKGTVGSLMYQLCSESGAQSCSVWTPNGDLYLDNDKWHASCWDEFPIVDGQMSYQFHCSGDWQGDFTASGVLKVNFSTTIGSRCPVTVNGAVSFAPSLSGNIGADSDFNFSCPINVDISCPKSKHCSGFFKANPPTPGDPSQPVISAGCEIKW